MDSRTALERLDAVRPGSDDLSLPEMAGLGDLLASDPAIATEHRRRQSWDRAVAVSMHDVPLPAGAKERLLERLAASTASETVREATPRVSRRRMLGALSGIAASLLAAGVYWVVASNAAHPVTVADVQNAAASLATGKASPEAFDGEFVPSLPAGPWQRLQAYPTLGLLPENGHHRAAAWRFTYGAKRSTGVLVAIPRDAVEDPPATKPEYVGGKAITWTGGDFVYVCRVEGPIDELLHQLENPRFA